MFGILYKDLAKDKIIALTKIHDLANETKDILLELTKDIEKKSDCTHISFHIERLHDAYDSLIDATQVKMCKVRYEVHIIKTLKKFRGLFNTSYENIDKIIHDIEGKGGVEEVEKNRRYTKLRGFSWDLERNSWGSIEKKTWFRDITDHWISSMGYSTEGYDHSIEAYKRMYEKFRSFHTELDKEVKGRTHKLTEMIDAYFTEFPLS